MPLYSCPHCGTNLTAPCAHISAIWPAVSVRGFPTPLDQAAANLIAKTRSLLEWMPQYSLSSSGHLRKLAVEMAIDRLEAHLKAAQL